MQTVDHREECKLVQPLWRTIWRFLKKLKIELPIWSCNLTPGHISRENHDLKRYMHPNVHCTRMFTAALFTIAKTGKQPKCPSTEEWIKKMWYIYTVEYYSAAEKNEIMPFAAIWMDLEIIILSKVSPIKTKIIWHYLYVESKKMI